MSKTKETTQQPTPFDELLKNGTATLKEKTRDELAELVNNIPADVKYMVGAIGRNPSGEYTIRVDIIK